MGLNPVTSIYIGRFSGSTVSKQRLGLRLQISIWHVMYNYPSISWPHTYAAYRIWRIYHHYRDMMLTSVTTTSLSEKMS